MNGYADAMAEYARNEGAQRPEAEWICTPFDVWARNPNFKGVPSGRHPEDPDYSLLNRRRD